jgi:enoyl-CoA hydratase
MAVQKSPNVSDTADEVVTWSVDERIQVVRMHRPPANALGLPMVEGLQRALDAFDASDARVLVIVSELDGFFAAGADIKLMNGYCEQGDVASFSDYGNRLREPLGRLYGHERPSIAAIEGLALGGGMELALAATLRVGSTDARLGLPESKIGLIPGAGGTQRLPRLVGRARALDLMLTARDVAAPEAHALGLLDRLVQPGKAEGEAMELARLLCNRSGAALTQIMRCVDDADDLQLDQGLAREADRVNTLFSGPEAREGLGAFVEKRRPDYA